MGGRNIKTLQSQKPISSLDLLIPKRRIIRKLLYLKIEMNKNRFILKERILKLNILTSKVRNIKEGNWVRLNKKRKQLFC